MSAPDTTAPAPMERNYPLPQPECDKRFTFGLLYDVAQLIQERGYPPLTGRDLVELGQALFRVLYVPTPIVEPEPVHLGDLVVGDWAPACGAPGGAQIAVEDSAVTCPDCVALCARRDGGA